MIAFGNYGIKKEKMLNLLFFAGFFLVSLSRMFECSAFVSLPDFLPDMMNVVGVVLFIVKFVFSRHGIRELFICLFCMALTLTLKLISGLSITIFITCCACVAMKGVSLKTILKIDLTIKSIFLLTHLLVFMADYASGFELAFDYIHEASKGTAMSLYFVNPNTAGLIGTWIAIEMLFLKDKKKWQDFIIPTLIATFTFLVTTSRTPFFVYIVYIGLQFIKNSNMLTILQKTAYPFFCAISFLVVSLLSPGMPIFDMVNPLLSGRLGLSIIAYNLVGISFLPSNSATTSLEEYPIDVFYVKCLVSYGIITMILAYIPHLLMPRQSADEAKRISIITSLYLMFEIALVNIGFAPAYLIIADSILNRKVNMNIGKNEEATFEKPNYSSKNYDGMGNPKQ